MPYYTAYPPLGDIRWNRTSNITNDYRSAGQLGYPCSKDLNWTEIPEMSPAVHYISDTAHGTTAGAAATVGRRKLTVSKPVCLAL
jgi:hypothetical protein